MKHLVMVLGNFGLSQAEADAEVIGRVLSVLCGMPVHPSDPVQDQGVFVWRWTCTAADGSLEIQLVNDENVDTAFVVVDSKDAVEPPEFFTRVVNRMRTELRAIDNDRLLRAARETWRTEPAALMRAALDSSMSWKALGPTLVEAAEAGDERTWSLCLQAMAMAPQGIAQDLLGKAYSSTQDPSRRASAQRLIHMFENARRADGN